MRQARCVLSTYSADVFGVCSALYELGGMLVMHDASGCNSTYSTHDEPRWFGGDSMVFISGLTEIDAIMGNDSRVVNDMLQAIEQLHPAFAALAGTPIPMLTGCDLTSVAAEVERVSGTPCFGFNTNGMRSYLCGASEAFAALAERMTDERAVKRRGTVNVLGATPLDFSVNGSVESAAEILGGDGWEVIGTWAMGSTLGQLRRAGEAEVNLVISGAGMKTAQVLRRRFGTPWVVGMPVGTAFTGQVLRALRDTARDGQDRMAFADYEAPTAGGFFIIGESVISRSLAAAFRLECGVTPRVICPLERLPELEGVLSPGDVSASEEDEIQRLCADAGIVAADPLYRPVLPQRCQFISLPHEAFSGRLARKDIPDLTKMDLKKIYGGIL